MKRIILTLALSCAVFAANAGDVTISNASEWNLDHLYMSSVDQDEWGADQLGDAVIGTGESFTLTGVPCATYDVKLVDEEGDECEVADVDICGDDGWEITSEDLLDCQDETGN